ncbi:MAG: hypothetical protein ABI840_03470 [bacterium]
MIINLIFFYTQKIILLNEGKGIDGAEYYEIAKEFSEGKEIQANAPLAYRIGTPFLASIIDKDDLIHGFFFANLIANFIAYILLFFFLKIYLKNFYLLIFLITLYLFHPLCNIRFIYFCPVITDPWGHVFFLTGLILIEKFRHNKSNVYILFLSVISFIGVLFREYIIIIPLSLLFINNPFANRNIFYLNLKKIFYNGIFIFFPLLSAIAGIIVTHMIVINTDSNHSFIKTAFYFFYEKSLFQYVHAWFVSVGPILAILIFFYKKVFKFLNENQHFLFLFFSTIVLSFAGGTDSRRIILWFIPIILLLEGSVIINHLLLIKKIFFIIPLILFQSISMKVFTQIPEPMRNNTELGVPIMPVLEDNCFLNLISPLEDLKFEFVSFLKYSFAIGFLMIILRYYYIKINKCKINSFKYTIKNNLSK